MRAKLVALSDGPDLVLAKPVMLVGRHAECDFQLHSGKISRRHCVIARVDDRLLVRDLGSTNGVRINGERVEEGQLRHGDEVAFGNFRYRVSIENGAAMPDDDDRLDSTEQPVALEDAPDSQVLVSKKAPPAEPGE
jgi:pSer/pThr/pTyr-binding forkhead associated (FHA) protein